MTEAGHCMFFVKRKNRFCRMTVREGRRFCGEHLRDESDINNIANGEISDKRVKCPLDSTHTCYESRLSKHLKVCNAKKLLDAQPDFVIKGVNVDTEVLEVPQRLPLSLIDQSVIGIVLNKISTAYDKLPQFVEEVLQHDILKDKVNDLSCGKTIRKHLVQNASLLAHLEQAGLVQDNTCFIEFGAGKDRSSHRHKSDNKLKNEGCALVIKRIRADIADLRLNNITEIQSIANKVGVAKHLCGAATDLTLHCLVNSMQNEPKFNVAGLVIAFCCHHKCEYASYVGKQYLKQCGFTAVEFPILCSIASWATCGSNLHKVVREDRNRCKEKWTDSEVLSSSKREEIGRKVKSLLNWGRVEFLRKAGFRSNLIYYTTSDVSLENMAIVATRVC